MDVFKMLWLSFGNTDAYKNAVFGWKWKSVLYFFLLSLLSSASAMLATHRVLGEFYDGLDWPPRSNYSKA